MSASEDALDRRHKKGLSIEKFVPLLKAHRASEEILKFLLGEDDCRLVEATNQIEENLSQASPGATHRIWDILRWYTEPHREKVGSHHFAARVLDLLDRWPNTESRFRNLLRDWALKRFPTEDIIKRYPWSISGWKHIVRRGCQKMGVRTRP